jgi:hypothetical protein
MKQDLVERAKGIARGWIGEREKSELLAMSKIAPTSSYKKIYLAVVKTSQTDALFSFYRGNPLQGGVPVGRIVIVKGKVTIYDTQNWGLKRYFERHFFG